MLFLNLYWLLDINSVVFVYSIVFIFFLDENILNEIFFFLKIKK